MKNIFKNLLRIFIIIKLGISIYCYFKSFTYVTILFPVVTNISILVLAALGISKRSVSVGEFLGWVSAVIIIILIDINAISINNRILFDTKSKIYFSPKYTRSIIIEQTQLLGEKSINIYEVKVGILRREIATQLIGNNIKVKWFDETKVLVLIDEDSNVIDLKNSNSKL